MYIIRQKNTQDLTMIGFPRVTESAEAMTKIPGNIREKGNKPEP